MSRAKCTFTSPRALLTIERILSALADGPLTAEQLATKLYRDRMGVVNYLFHLRQEPRRVRISGRLPSSGAPAPLYALGSEPDEVFPPLTYKERYHERMADPERYQAYLAWCRAYGKAKRGPRPVPMIARIAQLIEQRPGLTSRQLSACLGISIGTVSASAIRLAKAGTVREVPTGKRTKRWETVANPLPTWEAPKVIRQGAFSALFVDPAPYQDEIFAQTEKQRRAAA